MVQNYRFQWLVEDENNRLLYETVWCFGIAILFDKFWFVYLLFEGLGNVWLAGVIN